MAQELPEEGSPVMRWIVESSLKFRLVLVRTKTALSVYRALELALSRLDGSPLKEVRHPAARRVSP